MEVIGMGLKGLIERLIPEKHTIVFITEVGKIKVFKKKKRKDGTFSIKKKSYIPSPNTTVHLFLEGYAEEIDAEKLITEFDKKELHTTTMIESLIKEQITEKLAMKRLKLADTIKTYLTILVLVTLLNVLFTFFIYKQTNDLQQIIQNLPIVVKQIIETPTPHYP